MHKTQLIGVVCGVLVCLLYSGHGTAGVMVPEPAPPPTVDTPQETPAIPAVPIMPQAQTFAVCGPGTRCECENVVSLAQAYGGQSCTVTSSTGTCTFTAGENDVGMCCVCRP